MCGDRRYSVTVRAQALRQDGYPATAAVDSRFALVARGIAGGRDTSGMVMDLVSDTPGQLDVSLANVPATGWATGYTVMSASTGRLPSVGNFLGVELDPLAFSIVAQSPSAGNVFAFTNAGGSVYPNAAFSFPPAVGAALQGLTFDATALLLDATGNVVAVSNVDRVTVQ